MLPTKLEGLEEYRFPEGHDSRQNPNLIPCWNLLLSPVKSTLQCSSPAEFCC